MVILIFSRESFPMILVANKVDLMHLRKITREQGREMATKHNVSLQDYLMAYWKSYYRHSELKAVLIRSCIKAYNETFVNTFLTTTKQQLCSFLPVEPIHLWNQNLCGAPGCSKAVAITKTYVQGVWKCWEVFRMREESAPPWSEKAESGIRRYIQVPELVKDNEVNRVVKPI